MLAQQHLLGMVVGLFVGSTAPALSGAKVLRQRRRPLPADVDKAITVRLARSQPQQLILQPLDWTTLIGVEYMARATSPTAADEAVGPLVLAGHQLLVTDTTLAAAGFDLLPTPHLEWDEDELQERVGVCTAVYQLRHRTSFADLNA